VSDFWLEGNVMSRGVFVVGFVLVAAVVLLFGLGAGWAWGG
jgi:hypothetical protein